MTKHADSAGIATHLFGALVVLGLLVALVIVFDGDLRAISDWAWNQVANLIGGIAEFFTNNELFRDFVAGPSFAPRF